ncbi:hypothetical protein DAPPUDRAFT_105703 [Daphnia pulex]|uniref:Endonuclease/exonuclease/phosphatase domain-containing protein n=1 Tax=Daphnia pulex TaxID=6669 RepID=E9GRJ1_DAPPU|nr:hypothetical protein DAPPUDRAFT_105703 [Daphnia pulex]|eukprot:EFX77783.1 hypothetical protein DAPPUDRAFT_105703 [Daphnia pulex]
MGKKVVVMKRVKSQKKLSAELIYPNLINNQLSKGMRNRAYQDCYSNTSLNPIDLDLLTITEFWLTPEHGEEILRSVCPDGFRAVKITRPGKSGGGLAVIHRDTIRARSILLEARPATFEKLALSLQFNSTGFNLVVIYRPPASMTDVFMSEFSDLLEVLLVLRGRLEQSIRYFGADLTKLPLFTNTADDVNSFLNQYNSGLRDWLDHHAPLYRRTFAIRPDNPWSKPVFAAKRRSIRCLERRWKRTTLVIDGQILRARVQELRDARLQRISLYKIVDTFFLKKPTLKLSSHNSVLELAKRFSQFSTKKISDIRQQQIIGHQEPIPF